MKRKDFLKAAGLGLAGSLVGLNACSPKLKRQSVILVTMDTTRKDHLGCYGYSLPTSPNLDRFAGDAIVFEDCYSTSNVTLTSHASIFTGLYPHNHGVLGQEHLLPPEITALGNILGQCGYDTAAITSANHLNARTLGNGFQEFYAPQEIERPAEQTTSVAIDFLESAKRNKRPLFLWLHYWDPHWPYVPPEPYSNMFFQGNVTEERLRFITHEVGKGYELAGLQYTREELEQRFVLEKLDENDRKALISQYDGEIAYMDYHIGRFLAALSSTGFYDNSIIAFMSDHGESFFENDADGLRHGFIYEPVVRIPLLVRRSGIKGTRVKGFVQNIDVAPTFLKWLGLQSPELDGKDLDPLVSNDTQIREHIVLMRDGARIVAIVHGKHKMVQLAGRRQEPLPIPDSWKSEAQQLPRIVFRPPPPPKWRYEESRGIAMYCWDCPPRCGDRIENYVVEILTERTPRPGHVYAFEEIPKDRKRQFVFFYLRIKRSWNTVSVVFPTYLRVVGKDKEGKAVASSDIVPVELDSPLGHETKLFDLSVDPDERYNIAAQRPEVLRDLESRLGDYGNKCLESIEHGAAVLSGTGHVPSGMSNEDVSRLRALGYAH